MLGALAKCGRRAAALPHGFAWYSVKVIVPSMGDSISEGSISAVLKKGGEKVEENETIAQVETDKVTIDIKAPCDGTLLGLLVKQDDTVVPGQLVATVDESTAPAGIGGPPPKPDAAATATTASTSDTGAAAVPSAANAAPKAGDSAHARVASIRFPPRRTLEGEQISAMPTQQARQTLQRLLAAQASAAPAAPPAAAAAQPAEPAAPAKAPTPAPSKLASSVSRMTTAPPRRQLTDYEMEVIMLGGAAP